MRVSFLEDNPQSILSPDAIIDFSQDVVWPSVSYFFGRNFLTRSKKQEELHYEKAIKTARGLASMTLRATCWLEHNWTENPDPDSGLSIVEIGRGYLARMASVTFSVARPDMTDAMMAAGMRYEFGDDEDSEDEDFDDEDTGADVDFSVADSDTMAWETIGFHFYDKPEDPFYGSKSFEIRDIDGDVVWSDYELMTQFDDDGNEIAIEKVPLIIRKLNTRYSSNFSIQDSRLVRKSLRSLGVPPHITRNGARRRYS